jgi:hypothetical protein
VAAGFKRGISWILELPDLLVRLDEQHQGEGGRKKGFGEWKASGWRLTNGRVCWHLFLSLGPS